MDYSILPIMDRMFDICCEIMQRHCLVFKCGASDKNNLAPDRLGGTRNTLGSAHQHLRDLTAAHKAGYALNTMKKLTMASIQPTYAVDA